MDESWLKFRDDLSNALRAFVRGDAGPYTALWSHSADTSIMVPLAATTGDGTTSPNGWIGLPPSTATASTTASRSSPTLREQTLPTWRGGSRIHRPVLTVRCSSGGVAGRRSTGARAHTGGSSTSTPIRSLRCRRRRTKVIVRPL